MDEELLKLRRLVEKRLASAGGTHDRKNSCTDHLEKVENSCRNGSVAAAVIEDHIKGLTAALKGLLKKEPSSIIKGYGETTKKIIELAKSKKRAKRIPSTPLPPVQHTAQGYTSIPPPPAQHTAQGQRHTKRNIEEIILDWVKTVLISEKTQTEDEYRLQSEIPTTHTGFFREFKGLIDQVKENITYLNGRINDMEEQSERSLKGTATKSAVDEHQKKAMRDMREQLDKALKEKDHLQFRLLAENTELKEKLKKYEKRRSTTDLYENEKIKALEDEITKLKAKDEGKKSIKSPLSQAQAPITRLGQETGIQLAYDNPLTSDANKIGEKYSDLFDNSWVDAIENLMKDRKDEKEEEKCLGVLKDILLKCYSFCKWRSEEQIAQMETILFIPDHRDDIRHNINVVRKRTALEAVGPLKKDFFKREKVPSLCQEFVSDCVEFCWYMVIQEPPMVLYVGDEKSGSKIDIEKFKFYTRSGKLLDFVVWPALQLHADGPILRKGVVQPQAYT